MAEGERAAGSADDRRRGYWLPLAVGGVLLAGAVALYDALTHWAGLGLGISTRPGRSFSVLVYISPLKYFPPPTSAFALGREFYEPSFYYLGWYWAVALAAAFLLMVLWYRFPGRRAGRRYLVTAVVLLVLALALPLLTWALPGLASAWLRRPWVEGIPVLFITAVALGGLARARRSRALAGLTAAYAVVALVIAAWFTVTPDDPFGPLPPVLFGQSLSFSPVYALLLPAAVLIAAGLAARRRSRFPGWPGRRRGRGRLPA